MLASFLPLQKLWHLQRPSTRFDGFPMADSSSVSAATQKPARKVVHQPYLQGKRVFQAAQLTVRAMLCAGADQGRRRKWILPCWS